MDRDCLTDRERNTRHPCGCCCWTAHHQGDVRMKLLLIIASLSLGTHAVSKTVELMHEATAVIAQAQQPR